MPMTLRPGTTAIRTDTALIDRATSSARLMTREDFVPGAGSSSYRVTTGPGRTLTISPVTPKSASTHSSWRAFSLKASRLTSVSSLMSGGVVKRCSGGSWHSLGVAKGKCTFGRLGAPRRWRDHQLGFGAAGLSLGLANRLQRATAGEARLGLCARHRNCLFPATWF